MKENLVSSVDGRTNLFDHNLEGKGNTRLELEEWQQSLISALQLPPKVVTVLTE